MDAMLLSEYQTLGLAKTAEKLGLSTHIVKNRAGKIGARRKPHPLWNDKAIEVVKQRYAIDGPTVLAKELGTTHWAVTGKAKRLGILPKSTHFHWSEESLAFVRDNYEQRNPKVIGQTLGVSANAIIKQAGLMGLHTNAGHAEWGRIRAANNKSCDIHYFDKWTKNGAYLFGFSLADGCLTQGLNCLSFCLSQKDTIVLEFIAKELKITGRGVFYPKHVPDKRGWNTQPQCCLMVGSTVLVKRLVELGMFPRKTYGDHPFPDVPNEYLADFTRGYLDGDGSICISNDKAKGYKFCTVSFVGSVKFIEGLRDRLVSQLGIRRNVLNIRRGKLTDHAYVSWTSLHDLKALHAFLYPKNVGFCLDRKKRILDEWLSVTRYPRGHDPRSHCRGQNINKVSCT